MRFAALLLGLCLPALALAVPPMSDEIQYDHGSRYSARNESSARCALKRVGDELLLVTKQPKSLDLYRRTLDGQEIDRNPIVIDPAASPPMDFIQDYDVSDFDGTSIKIACVDRPTEDGLWRVAALNVDAATLTVTDRVLLVAGTTYQPRHLRIVWSGEAHMIVWSELSGPIHYATIAPDFTLLQRDQVLRDDRIQDWPFDVAFGSEGGWIAFPSGNGNLHLVPVSRSVTLGTPIVHAEADWRGDDIRIIPVEEHWAVYAPGIENNLCQFLLHDGALEGDPIQWPSLGDMGTALASSGSTLLVCERGYLSDAVSARRVDRERGLLDTARIFVDSLEANSAHEYGSRSIACVGSDVGFTLLWGEHDEESFCILAPIFDLDLPTKFARLSAEGQVISPGPVRANVATATRSTATVAVGGGLLALSEDSFSFDTIQSRRLDADGTPVLPGHEVSVGQYSDERCSWARVEALRVRAQGDKAFAAYQWTKVVGPEPEHGLSMIQVDEVNDEGLLVQRHSLAVIDWVFGPNQPTQIDAASMAGGIAAAFDVKLPQYEPLPPRVHVLFESKGQSKTERVIDNGTMTASPTLASLGDSLLVVWSELIGGQWQIRRAVVDPAAQTPIVGDTFLEEPGSLQYPWLIPGDDQLLCAWWSGGEVHAARLDSRGRLLDPSPLILSAGPAVPGSIDGVWSGLNYVVAWQQAGHVRANRVTARGRVADGVGFDVAVSSSSPGALASLTDGKVAIPYGDRIRFLTDEAVPVAPVSLAVEASSQGVQLQWEVSGEFGGASSRLARRALRSPDELAPPPEGYARIAAEVDFGGAGSHRYLDTDVDAGQWYAYAIALPLEDGSLIWSAPSIVQAEASVPTFALSAPTPNPVRGVASFRFSLPSTRNDARLEIFDAAGRLVRRIVLGPLEAGSHEIAWDGRDDAGVTPPSGLYLARLSASGSKAVRFLRLR